MFNLKKVIAILAIVCLTGGYASSAYAQIKGKVKWRIAKRPACKTGVGFRCFVPEISIEIDFKVDAETDGDNTIASTAWIDNDVFNMEIDATTGVTPTFYTNYLSGNNFTVEEDSELPRNLLDALKYTGTFTFKAGAYPIVKRNGKITISIRKN